MGSITFHKGMLPRSPLGELCKINDEPVQQYGPDKIHNHTVKCSFLIYHSLEILDLKRLVALETWNRRKVT